MTEIKAPKTFKDENRAFQQLVREHKLLRAHNLRFKEGDPEDSMLFFAEGALILVIIERFLRILPAIKATSKDTLYNLLEKAVRYRALELPAHDEMALVKKINDVRNTLLHGNFEQAAEQASLPSSDAYFKTQFAAEVESLYKIANFLVLQIDPVTGERVEL